MTFSTPARPVTRPSPDTSRPPRSTVPVEPTTSADATRPQRAGKRPSLAAALLQAWRTWQESDVLLPVGPAASGPWAGSDDADQDRVRVLADLRAVPPDRAH